MLLSLIPVKQTKWIGCSSDFEKVLVCYSKKFPLIFFSFSEISQVQDWHCLIGPLIDKLFAEPSNAIIVRFLSYISEHLGEAGDVVIHRVLLQMKGQEEWVNCDILAFSSCLFLILVSRSYLFVCLNLLTSAALVYFTTVVS